MRDVTNINVEVTEGESNAHLALVFSLPNTANINIQKGSLTIGFEDLPFLSQVLVSDRHWEIWMYTVSRTHPHAHPRTQIRTHVYSY